MVDVVVVVVGDAQGAMHTPWPQHVLMAHTSPASQSLLATHAASTAQPAFWTQFRSHPVSGDWTG